ncbi:MAG: hypothetical protein Q9174_002437 [Haloplaca sp. 1 TL-2023]
MSEAFTILVGSDKHKFTIEEACLKKCPVFLAMLEGQFKGYHERCIQLPEDEPEEFEIILDYLNTDHLRTDQYFEDDQQKLEDIKIHLDVLSTADKYGLIGMKDAILARFVALVVSLGPMDQHLEEVLSVMEISYDLVADGDDYLPCFVRGYASTLYAVHHNDAKTVAALNRWKAKGGRFAMDIRQGCNDYFGTAVEKQGIWKQADWCIRDRL